MLKIVVKKPKLGKAVVIEARTWGPVSAISDEQEKLLKERFEDFRPLWVDPDIDFTQANDVFQQIVEEGIKNIVFYFTPIPLLAKALIERWGLLGRVEGIQSLTNDNNELEKVEKIGEEALKVWVLWNEKREISFSRTDKGIVKKTVTAKTGWEIVQL